MGGVTGLSDSMDGNLEFLLTRLMRGVTFINRSFLTDINISTHTPHARRDAVRRALTTAVNQFLLTRLMRGVTISLMILIAS